jgi:hypothetical protein
VPVTLGTTNRGKKSGLELGEGAGRSAGKLAKVLLKLSVLTLISRNERREKMLWTIFVVLVVLWLLGMVSSYTLGGFIHLLLVIAVAVVLIQIIQGRRPV